MSNVSTRVFSSLDYEGPIIEVYVDDSLEFEIPTSSSGHLSSVLATDDKSFSSDDVAKIIGAFMDAWLSRFAA